MQVGNNLKDIRHDHRMNMKEFAAFLDVNYMQYYKWERHMTQPSIEWALRISNKVNLPVNQIFYLIE